MRSMTQKEKKKYKELVSNAKQLRFDVNHFSSQEEDDGLPLYICRDGYMQYFFSKFPAEDKESDSE